MAKRKTKKKIWTDSAVLADEISEKLRLIKCNHFRRDIDGLHIFTPTKFHKRKFEKILPMLQATIIKIREADFN